MMFLIITLLGSVTIILRRDSLLFRSVLLSRKITVEEMLMEKKMYPPEHLGLQSLFQDLGRISMNTSAEKLSEQGKKAKSMQVHTHTTGATSFARKRDRFNNETLRDSPIWIEFFCTCHSNPEISRVGGEELHLYVAGASKDMLFQETSEDVQEEQQQQRHQHNLNNLWQSLWQSSMKKPPGVQNQNQHVSQSSQGQKTRQQQSLLRQQQTTKGRSNLDDNNKDVRYRVARKSLKYVCEPFLKSLCLSMGLWIVAMDLHVLIIRTSQSRQLDIKSEPVRVTILDRLSIEKIEILKNQFDVSLLKGVLWTHRDIVDFPGWSQVDSENRIQSLHELCVMLDQQDFHLYGEYLKVRSKTISNVTETHKLNLVGFVPVLAPSSVCIIPASHFFSPFIILPMDFNTYLVEILVDSAHKLSPKVVYYQIVLRRCIFEQPDDPASANAVTCNGRK
ncbi:ribose 5-phosphate isomerase A [Tanacetum coccineum]